MDADKRLENLVKRDKIIEMMNGNSSGAEGIEIYEVSPSMAESLNIDPKVLTYLVEYQLADMPLDLQEYMDKAMEALKSKREISIPDIPPEHAGYVSPSSPLYINEDGNPVRSEEGPFLMIPLNDMGKLVQMVTRKFPDGKSGKFGLKIPDIPETSNLVTNLQLKIPALGITDYIYGQWKDNELFFVNDSRDDFYPREKLKIEGRDSYELWIYARIFGACEGTIEPAIIFEWFSALIDTGAAGSSSFKEKYDIGDSFGDFLGGAASFKKSIGICVFGRCWGQCYACNECWYW